MFARTVDASGVDGYQSVLIVNAKSGPDAGQGARSATRRLTFGIGDALSTSGTLAPMTYLFAPRDIDPRPASSRCAAPATRPICFAVANGQLDVATNNTTSLMLNQLERPAHEADAGAR